MSEVREPARSPDPVGLSRLTALNSPTFCAAIPEYVDGGAQIVAVCRYRLADQGGPASATVLADWGDDHWADDEWPRWGTHVMTYEPDWRLFLLWHGRYFPELREAWIDLGHRLP